MQEWVQELESPLRPSLLTGLLSSESLLRLLQSLELSTCREHPSICHLH